MRETIHRLIQLQELSLLRDEQRSIKGAKADTAQLDASIKGLEDSLPEKAKAFQVRLSKKDHIVMSPVNDGRCSMCGMSIAISQVQAVKLCKDLVPCPSCGRILYDPDGAKWVAARPKRSSGERKVGIARFSQPELMVTPLKATTPRGAIEELAARMQSAKLVDDSAKLVEAAMAREEMLGTGIGHGLAFPHVRGIEGGGLSLAMGVSPKGIRWEGSDSLVHFVFFSTIPTAVSVFYLRLLAGLVDSYTKDTNRKAALDAKSPELLWKALVKATRFSVK